MKKTLFLPLLVMIVLLPPAYSENILKEDLWIMTTPQDLNFGYDAPQTWSGGQFSATNTYYLDILRFEMRNVYQDAAPTGFFRAVLYSDSGDEPTTALAYSELIPASAFGSEGAGYFNYTVNFNSTNKYQLQSGTLYWMTYKDLNTNMVPHFQLSMARDNSGSWYSGHTSAWTTYSNDEPVFQIWENASVNIAPEIFINSVTTSLGTTTLSNGTRIKYVSTNLSFNITFSDSDGFVSTYNITILMYNGSLSGATINHTMNIDGEIFADYITEQPYRLIVSAVDNGGAIASASLYFGFNDSAIPTYSGFGAGNVYIGDSYTWDAFIYDEYLWNFSVLCTNGFNYSVSQLGTQSFHFANSTVISGITICDIDFCDGHTGNSIGDMAISKTTNNILTFDNKELNFINAQSFSFEKHFDKYSFCVQMSPQNSRMEINIPKECIKSPNSPYKGHYVCGAYAIDFENEYNLKVEALGNTVYIDVGLLKELCFNSIVSLNCVSLTQTINGETPPVYYNNTVISEARWFTDDLNTSSTKGILLWFFLIMIFIGMIIYSEYTRIPALFMLTALYGICLSIAVFASISVILGVIFLIFSLGIIVRGIILM